MDKQKSRIHRMDSPVAGIDLGEKESFATYMAPYGDISEPFRLPMTTEGRGDLKSRKSR